MPRVRTGAVLAAVRVLTLGGALPSEAKGDAWVELDRRYYAPGNVVMAKVWSSGSVEESLVDEAGTVNAYLGSRDDNPAPRRLPEGALLLGSAEVRDRKAPDRIPLLQLTFSVPEVPPGWYSVRFFDAQGRAIEGFDGLLRVVRSTEVVVDKEVAYWEGELQRVLRHRGRQMGRMRERIEDLELLARDDVLGAPYSDLERAAPNVDRLNRGEPGASSAPGWGLAAMALAGLAAGLLIGKSWHRE